MEVQGTAPLVDETKTDVSQVVDSQQILDLPINGRRVDTFVLLTPGVTNDGIYGLLTFRGVANGNTFLLDGNDTTEQFYVENAGRTRIRIADLPGRRAGIPGGFRELLGRIRPRHGRRGEHRHPQRHQRSAWHRVLVFPQSGFRRARCVLHASTRTMCAIQRGASLGGPFIKNKLFFFFNADLTNRNFPADSSIIKAGVVNTTTEQWVGCARRPRGAMRRHQRPAAALLRARCRAR